MNQLSIEQCEDIADDLDDVLEMLEALDFTPCFMHHERIKPGSIHKTDEEIDPDIDYTPICAEEVRNRNPNCNHLDPKSPVNNAIITVSTAVNMLCANEHKEMLQKIRERWNLSLHKRECIDKNVVQLLSSSRTNKKDANVVQMERKRHTNEIRVVQQICNDLQALASKILAEVEEKLE